MGFKWFGGWNKAAEENVHDLVARKQYDRAIELLRAELQQRPLDRRLRLQLGEVMVLAGRLEEAGDLLKRLADELRVAGFGAQALAVLRKIQGFQPDRSDVRDAIARLSGAREDSLPNLDIKGRPSNAREDEWTPMPVARDVVPETPETPDAPPAAPPAAPPPAVVEAPAEPPQGIAPAEPARAAAGTAPAEGAPAPVAAPPVEDAPVDIVVETEDEDVVLSPAPKLEVAATPEDPGAPVLLASLPERDRQQLLDRLPMHVFGPGEILLSEGEPGESVFILLKGRVRAYVKDKAGRNVALRELHAGDFFGELARPNGRKRATTVTAAEHCEVVELDGRALDALLAAHDTVRDVFENVYEERAHSPQEMQLRGKKVRRAHLRKPAPRPRAKRAARLSA